MYIDNITQFISQVVFPALTMAHDPRDSSNEVTCTLPSSWLQPAPSHTSSTVSSQSPSITRSLDPLEI